jgi:hypothetical protein
MEAIARAQSEKGSVDQRRLRPDAVRETHVELCRDVEAVAIPLGQTWQVLEVRTANGLKRTGLHHHTIGSHS